MVFVIFMFSEGHVEHVLAFLESTLPFMKGQLSTILKKQQEALTAGVATEGEKPFVAQLWDYFIILMISYFVVSIINSLAQGHYNDLKELKEEKENEKKDKKK